jgi:hypothetical protein
MASLWLLMKGSLNLLLEKEIRSNFSHYLIDYLWAFRSSSEQAKLMIFCCFFLQGVAERTFVLCFDIDFVCSCFLA